MNHQPFEEWLLNDKLINPKERLELEAHLRTCASCSALAETGNALRTVKMVSPAAGFTARFQTRLAIQKAAERRRRLWGSVFFTLGGLVILMWITGPYIASFFASPATWITSLVGWGVFLLTTLEAIAEAGIVLLRIAPSVMSPFAWMVVLSALAGFSLLWSVSIWRFTRRGLSQGV
jgi:anti-sigma factor RsiW